MGDQKLMLDLRDFTVESIEVVPADSLDSAAYGGPSCFMPDESDDA